MKKLLIPIFSLLTTSLMGQVNIGQNKKIIDINSNENQLTIILKDTVLDKKKKNSCFIFNNDSLIGPFKNVKIHNYDPTCYIIDDGEEEFVHWRNQRIKLQNQNIEISEIRLYPKVNHLVYIPNIKNDNQNKNKREGYLYFVDETKYSLIKKTEIDEKNIISVSPNLDILYQGEENSFIYKGIKSNSVLEVGFRMWLKSDDNYFPIWSQIENGGPYGTYEVLYQDTKEIIRFVSSIWVFKTNATNTDFAVVGFEEINKPSTIITSKSVVGKYYYIENVNFDNQDKLCFEYKEGNDIFQKKGDNLTKIKSNQLYSVVYNEDKSDSLKIYRTNNNEKWTYREKIIFEGSTFECELKNWSKQFGPIVIFSKNKKELHYVINGEPSKQFDRIASFTEAKNKHFAFSVYDNDGFYIITEKQKYGPYYLIVPFYNSHNYVHIDSIGNVYYTVNVEDKYIHYKNGEKFSEYDKQSQLYFGENDNSINIYEINSISKNSYYDITYSSVFDNLFYEMNLRYFATNKSNDDFDEEDELDGNSETPIFQINCNSNPIAKTSSFPSIKLLNFKNEEFLYIVSFDKIFEGKFYSSDSTIMKGLNYKNWIIFIENNQLKVSREEIKSSN